MTEDEARALLPALIKRGGFGIRNMDGEWGIRVRDGRFFSYALAPYEEPRPEKEQTEEEVLETLRTQSLARMRMALGLRD